MWRRWASRTRDTYCRPCRSAYHRQHYLKNKQRYIENNRKRVSRVMQERYEYLLLYFQTHPCVECGEKDPVVLEFDHLGDKSFDVARGIRDKNWNEVLAEMEKCEVVCANCHRRRTALRGGFLRAAMAAAESGRRESDPRH